MRSGLIESTFLLPGRPANCTKNFFHFVYFDYCILCGNMIEYECSQEGLQNKKKGIDKMRVSQIYSALIKVLQNMSNPNLEVAFVDASKEVVEFTNGVQYSLRSYERIK